MSIAPVIRRVEVKVDPARAFDLFTRHIGRWWPKGKTVGQNPHADIVVEPFSGGRWFERDEEGTETDWGRVLAWEPPSRLLLAWQLNSRWKHDPDFSTEVELIFEALAEGGTRVTLEHRNLERFGPDAERVSQSVGAGWAARLSDFAANCRLEP